MAPGSRLHALCVAAGLALLGATGPAAAHAVLLSSTPADGVVLGTAPEAVTLVFNEPVTPLAVNLVGPRGAKAALTGLRAGGPSLIAPLPAGLGSGTHVLSWRVVSADGHPVGGSLIFSIGAATAAAPQAGASLDTAVAVLIWLARLVIFAGLFVGAGGAVFGALMPGGPVPRHRTSAVLIFAGLVAIPASVALQGIDALGEPLASAVDPRVWAAGFATAYGATATAAVAAFLLGLLCLAVRPSVGRRAVALVALAAVGLVPAASGHAAAAEPQWLTRTALFLHGAGIAFWVGALGPLATLLRRDTPEGRAALARFSRVIPWAVAPIVASGIALAAVQLGAPSSAWLSPYGAILAAKLVLLVALFALAGHNRLRLTQPALAGAEAARRRLRSAIRTELAVVLAIFALVAVWRFTPPPRAEAAPPPAVAHLHSDALVAEISVVPGRPGPVTVELRLSGTAPAESVVVSFSEPAQGIEPRRYEAGAAGDGAWRIVEATLPVAGTWHVAVEARLGRFELVRAAGEITIP